MRVPLAIDDNARGEDIASMTTLLLAASQNMTASIEDVVGRHGLGSDHWRVLDRLVRHGEMPVTELADSLLISGPTMTRITDRLVSDALIFRSPAENDRRRVIVQASQRGRQAHSDIERDLAAAEDQVLRRLSRKERATLDRLLRAVSQSA